MVRTVHTRPTAAVCVQWLQPRGRTPLPLPSPLFAAVTARHSFAPIGQCRTPGGPTSRPAAPSSPVPPRACALPPQVCARHPLLASTRLSGNGHSTASSCFSVRLFPVLARKDAPAGPTRAPGPGLECAFFPERGPPLRPALPPRLSLRPPGSVPPPAGAPAPPLSTRQGVEGGAAGAAERSPRTRPPRACPRVSSIPLPWHPCRRAQTPSPSALLPPYPTHPNAVSDCHLPPSPSPAIPRVVTRGIPPIRRQASVPKSTYALLFVRVRPAPHLPVPRPPRCRWRAHNG